MQNNKNKKHNQCCKCNHKWKQRGKKSPKKCPSCTSPNWNKMSNSQMIGLIVGDYD